MIEVVNRQRTAKIPNADWAALANRVLDHIGKNGFSATIAFVSDEKIRTLNRSFRGIDKATDVLSFPAGTDGSRELGDIAIAIERAKVQARQNRLPLKQEISQLILHGLLHLCGYDHERDHGEMNRLELRLRRRLGI